jgi:BirA family biotin operon repressor/biotin-[acetyl-CoA-carboxylase] ligase
LLYPDRPQQSGAFNPEVPAMLQDFLGKAPFTRAVISDEADFMLDGFNGKILRSGLAADIFICAECSSTFDLAWLLAKHDMLSKWASVLALRQTAGRGQLRRGWYSPLGNLYASLRLPEKLIHESSSSILTALLFLEAFIKLGLRLKFKWPNDLVLCTEKDNTPGKLGGLLLEERDDILLAGVGINCSKQPEAMLLRENTALYPAVLPENFSLRLPIPLWVELVQKLIFVYDAMFTTTSIQQLLSKSEEYLLWKGTEVQVLGSFAEDSVITGFLRGLTEQGGLRLLVPCSAGSSVAVTEKFEEISLFSGSLKRKR